MSSDRTRTRVSSSGSWANPDGVHTRPADAGAWPSSTAGVTTAESALRGVARANDASVVGWTDGTERMDPRE